MDSFILTAFADEIDEKLETQIDVIKSHNINHIEMRGVNGKSLVEYSLDEVKLIKKQLDENNIKISAIGSPIGKIKITDDFEPHLNLFKHTLDIAEILETKYIRMFSFYIDKDDDPNEYREEVLNRWNQFVKLVKNKDIVLLHENEKGIYGDVPERCLDLVKSLNCDKVKLIFDPANFVQCEVETYSAYEKLKNYIVYFHIKDAKMDTKKVVPSGCGDGQIRKILNDAYNTGYKGFLSLEPHLGNFSGLAKLEQEVISVTQESSGADKFAIAANALKNIIKVIEKQ